MRTTRNAGFESEQLMRGDTLERVVLHEAAGRLALEVMHEVRNPLESLSYLTYLALEEAHNPEKVKKYMRLAREQVETLTEISSQALGYAQSTSSPMPHDLVILAESALRIHRRTIDRKKIHLVKRFPEDLTAHMYKSEMLQVLWNLIGNALDAMPDEGTLTLRIRKSQGTVHLLIADNGHGIDKENIETIFEPFFTTKEQQGTGLGLSITKKIVDHHRGTLRVRSCIKEGKSGTSFKMCFPVEGLHQELLSDAV